MSVSANKTLEKINHALCIETNLYDIYTQIVHEIENFSLSHKGISKDTIDFILTDLIGNCSNEIKEKIFIDCTLHKKTISSYDGGIYDGAIIYGRLKEQVYYYDSEDVWYCLKNYDATNKVIIGRRYRDIEDIFYSVENKFLFYDDWV